MDREKREAEAKAAADAERAANAEKNGLLANAKGGDSLKKLANGKAGYFRRGSFENRRSCYCNFGGTGGH